MEEHEHWVYNYPNMIFSPLQGVQETPVKTTVRLPAEENTRRDVVACRVS